MAFGGDDTGSGGSISQINVTPLVDVMLVLLIIFMVAAPILQQGVAIDLPAVRNGNLETPDQPPMVVSIDAGGSVYLDETPYDLAKLATTVAGIVGKDATRKVFIRADAGVPYGKVMEVMAAVRSAGVTQVGLVTEPPPGRS